MALPWGACLSRILFCIAPAVACLAASESRAQSPPPRLTIQNPLPAVGDQFGRSAALVGAFAAIGAPGNDFVFSGSGSVYIVDPTTGTLQRTINNPAPSSGDGFGATLAPVGPLLFIGAPNDDATGTNSGAAYLYDPADGDLKRTFDNPAADGGDQFGFSAAEADGQLLVGAPFAHVGPSLAGVVYMIDPTTPSVTRTFTNPEPDNFDQFGAAVAALPGIAIIGAPAADETLVADVGRVYVYDAATGEALRTLLDPEAKPGDLFGALLTAADGKIAVGAPGVDAGSLNAGAVYVYDLASGDPLISILNPSPSLFGQPDAFGGAVALGGGNVLIGAFGDDGAENDAGAAFLYRLVSGFNSRELLDPAAAMFDGFGASVAANAQILLVGAPTADLGSEDAGAVYLFANVGVTAAEVAQVVIQKLPDPGDVDLNGDGAVDAADAVAAAQGEAAGAN